MRGCAWMFLSVKCWFRGLCSEFGVNFCKSWFGSQWKSYWSTFSCRDFLQNKISTWWVWFCDCNTIDRLKISVFYSDRQWYRWRFQRNYEIWWNSFLSSWEVKSKYRKQRLRVKLRAHVTWNPRFATYSNDAHRMNFLEKKVKYIAKKSFLYTLSNMEIKT